ncbi:DUF7343 domain-containing protein [Halorussus salinisoli]|uniref:DUF7343 domain-containing protein n=1 Tax=Halorussus salinisoli TaxID=2558242 RepID=UPI0010C17C70|nr:helix-turn-helix domain-containing protein [Halorussus salinisoli]
MDSEMTGRSTVVAGLLACALVVALVAPVATTAQTDVVAEQTSVTTTQTDVLVQDVSISGDAVATRNDGTVYLWPSRSYTLTATVDKIATAAEYRICALTDAVELNCTTTTLRPVTAEVELQVSESVALGAQNVTVTMERVGTNETLVAGQLARIHVLRPTGDTDDDGLQNRDERAVGTNPALADTDGDFLDDGTEVALGTDPLNRGTAFVFGAVAMLVAAVVAGLLFRYGPRIVAPLRESAGRSSSSPTSESSSAVERTPRSTPDERSPDSGSTLDSESDSSPPFSDEERVIQLLEEEDGQLRQSEIVSRTPWSKSKVSRLLARMDEQQQVVKINAGRQNVIVLPGEEPAKLESLRGGDER